MLTSGLSGHVGDSAKLRGKQVVAHTPDLGQSSATASSNTAAAERTNTVDIDIKEFLSKRATNRKHIAFMIRSNPVMRMLLDGLNTDITLEARGGRKFTAHASILASYSPVWNTIFKNRAEGKINPAMPELVDELTLEALQLFVVLMYLVPLMPDGVILRGLEAAVIAHFDELVTARLRFQAPQLDPILTSAMAKILTPENC